MGVFGFESYGIFSLVLRAFPGDRCNKVVEELCIRVLCSRCGLRIFFILSLEIFRR